MRSTAGTLFLISVLLVATVSAAQSLPLAASFRSLPDEPLPQPQEQDKSTTSSSPKQVAPQRLIPRILDDQIHIYKGPFTRKALPKDAAFLTLIGVLVATDKYSADAVPNGGRNQSTAASNAMIGAGVLSAASVWGWGLVERDRHAREFGLLSTEVIANSMVVYAITNYATGRWRPYQDDHRGHFFEHHALNSSFPSGHTMVGWSLAYMAAHEYPKPWVKVLAYGGATGITVTRLMGSQHFPADVVAGGTLGYFIARQIFRRHCDPDLSSECPARK
jgi:membrane-associated phospholipid phosphatase